MAKPPARGRARTDTRRAGHAAERARAARRQQTRRPLWIGFVIVVVVVVAAGIALVARGSTKSASRTPAPAALVAKVTSVPASVAEQVGQGSATAPKRIDAPALASGGRVRVVYIGAEYCPYCATERWAMVVALSRFGTFSGLQLTESSSVDVFPSTRTFSFYGSSYASKYVVFEPVETATNQLSGNGSYQKLETPTAEQEELIRTYDAPPYVSSGSAGGIPFVDFGGKYIVDGATYDASVLQHKSADAIASALSDPSTAISRGAVGAANAIVAALCTLTGERPTATCAAPAVKALQSKLG